MTPLSIPPFLWMPSRFLDWSILLEGHSKDRRFTPLTVSVKTKMEIVESTKSLYIHIVLYTPKTVTTIPSPTF